jgi:hypothetical protein
MIYIRENYAGKKARFFSYRFIKFAFFELTDKQKKCLIAEGFKQAIKARDRMK